MNDLRDRIDHSKQGRGRAASLKATRFPQLRSVGQSIFSRRDHLRNLGYRAFEQNLFSKRMKVREGLAFHSMISRIITKYQYLSNSYMSLLVAVLMKFYVGLSYNRRNILFLEMLLDKTVSAG